MNRIATHSDVAKATSWLVREGAGKTASEAAAATGLSRNKVLELAETVGVELVAKRSRRCSGKSTPWRVETIARVLAGLLERLGEEVPEELSAIVRKDRKPEARQEDVQP